MFETSDFHEAPSGARLAYHHAPAEGTPRAILLVNHGLVEHSGRYRGFAEAMAARGFAVYAHDHRGHGETVAEGAPLGRFAPAGGAEKVIADVKAIRDLAVSRHGALPVLLFGHSMGGLIALNAAVSHPQDFRALAVWNSNFNPGIAGRFAEAVLYAEQMLKGSDVPSTILPLATFRAWGRSIPGRQSDSDWLSRDRAEVEKYDRDPLCRFEASVSMWRDVFALTFRAPAPAMLARLPKHLPIHLVGGGKDPATRGGREITWLGRRLERHGFTDVTTRIYDEMRHETLNELGREEAIADFADWAERALAGR